MRSMNANGQSVDTIRYHLSWPQPHTHYFHVQIELSRLGSGDLEVRMPAWRPGRYIIQNYARYIIGFEAYSKSGEFLPFRKTDKNTWKIEAGDEQDVVVRYQAYANVLDAGESYLDEHEAYVNPISVLMYVPGEEFTPSIISFSNPQEWKVATALDYDESKQGYPASDYHELVDSPFIISPDLRTYGFDHGGATYELVFQGEGHYNPDEVLHEVQRIVHVQTEMMGVTPFKRYVFLYHLLPDRFGHGVEHKNSTCIVIGPADYSDAGFRRRFLDLTAHELFHVWSVERIRPLAIYHPDYSMEAYTTTMWVYEGITCYYTDLTLARAGLFTEEEYLQELADTIQRYDRAPGRKVRSVALTSWDSWIGPAAAPGTWHSFYTSGNVLGLLLDFEIRHRTANEKSLDDVFRYLYAEYAEKNRGVPEEGFQQALEHVADSRFDAFFRAYVYGVEDIVYNDYLRHAGLLLTADPASGVFRIERMAEQSELQEEMYSHWLRCKIEV